MPSTALRAGSGLSYAAAPRLRRGVLAAEAEHFPSVSPDTAFHRNIPKSPVLRIHKQPKHFPRFVRTFMYSETFLQEHFPPFLAFARCLPGSLARLGRFLPAPSLRTKDASENLVYVL